MCYDISFTTKLDSIEEFFPELIHDDQITMDIVAAGHILGPGLYSTHPIIYRNREDQLPHLRLMEWGVIPFFTNDSDKLKRFMPGRNKWLNIRADRILDDKSSYWYKIRDRRCLIPVTGIYEHREVKGWKKKVPYFVRPCDQKITFIPGLYSVAEVTDLTTGEIETRRTFGMVTRNANSLMRNIHNSGDNRYRMPLFLPFEMSQEWLNKDLLEADYRRILDYEMPSEDLLYHTTFTIRSPKPRPDNLEKYEPYEWPKLPELGLANPD